MKTISLEQAVAMIPNGASLMIGGFMAVGTPERVPGRLADRREGLLANWTIPGKMVPGMGARLIAIRHQL